MTPVESCFLSKIFDDPSPGPRRLVKTPVAVHPPLKGAREASHKVLVAATRPRCATLLRQQIPIRG
jgi:hypothetical protein